MPRLLWSLPTYEHGAWVTRRGAARVRFDPKTQSVTGVTTRAMLPAVPFDVPFDLALMLRSAQLCHVLGITWEEPFDMGDDEVGSMWEMVGSFRRVKLGAWQADPGGSNGIWQLTATMEALDQLPPEQLIAFHYGRWVLEHFLEGRYELGLPVFEPPAPEGPTLIRTLDP